MQNLLQQRKRMKEFIFLRIFPSQGRLCRSCSTLIFPSNSISDFSDRYFVGGISNTILAYKIEKTKDMKPQFFKKKNV